MKRGSEKIGSSATASMKRGSGPLGPAIGRGALTSKRKTQTMTETSVDSEIHQPLNIFPLHPTQVGTHLQVSLEEVGKTSHLSLGQIPYPMSRRKTQEVTKGGGPGLTQTVNLSQPDHHPTMRGYLNP